MSGYSALARNRSATLVGVTTTARAGGTEITTTKDEPFLASLLGVAGGLTAGYYCSRAWPAHPIWGFFLGYTFLGSPIGSTVGRAISK